MRILFIGQLGLPLLRQRDVTTAESRVAQLAPALAAKGHAVKVLGTAPYVAGTGLNYHGVQVQRIASLNPQQPGGWLYLLRSALAAWRFRPAVIHAQGWRAAGLARVARLGNRQATIVWTQDTELALPRWIARWVAYGVDEITATTRQVQYQLLTTYGIRAAYIPHGYTTSALPAVSPRHFGIRASRFNVLLAESVADVRRVAKAYKQSGMRTKLVVLQAESGAYRRLARQYSFLQFVGPITGRGRRSLIEQSQMTIVDGRVSAQVILESMVQGAVLVAANHPLAQELLGTAARFYSLRGVESLVHALKQLGSGDKQLARSVKKRAQTHFALERVLSEYLASYQAYRRVVSIDSVKRPSFTQLPAA